MGGWGIRSPPTTTTVMHRRLPLVSRLSRNRRLLRARNPLNTARFFLLNQKHMHETTFLVSLEPLRLKLLFQRHIPTCDVERHSPRGHWRQCPQQSCQVRSPSTVPAHRQTAYRQTTQFLALASQTARHLMRRRLMSHVNRDKLQEGKPFPEGVIGR